MSWTLDLEWYGTFEQFSLTHDSSVSLLVGPNGCGKSLLLSVLATLKDYTVPKRHPDAPVDAPTVVRLTRGGIALEMLWLGKGPWDWSIAIDGVQHNWGAGPVSAQNEPRVQAFIQWVRDIRVGNPKGLGWTMDEWSQGVFEKMFPGAPPNLDSSGARSARALLYLVSRAKPGSLVGIDGFGADLHPYAIRVLNYEIGERAEALNLSVLIATHDTELISGFFHNEENVFVFERYGFSPERLDEAHDPVWLLQARTGGLYSRLQVASPVGFFNRDR